MKLRLLVQGLGERDYVGGRRCSYSGSRELINLLKDFRLGQARAVRTPEPTRDNVEERYASTRAVNHG